MADVCDFVEFVESELTKGHVANAMLATRVFPSFLASMRGSGCGEVSEETLNRWMVDLLLKGSKYSTCRRYLGTLHAVYKAWRPDDGGEDDPFLAVKKGLAAVCAHIDREAVANLALLPRLLKKSGAAADRQTIDIILYLFYDVRATLADVVELTYGATATDCPQIEEIVERSKTAPNAKYVFALRQGKRRPQQIVRELLAEMHATLGRIGMNFNGSFSRESLTAMWIAAAAACGIPVAEIRAVAGTLPPAYAFLALIRPQQLDRSRVSGIINRVADAVDDHAIRWFVMKLRTGRRPKDIRSLLKQQDEKLLKEIAFYYPTRKTVRKEQGRLVSEEIPYLPDLLFFRLRSDRVRRLFGVIGEAAWCFRTTNRPDSPYSWISRREMAEFQRYVGEFTPDVELEIVSRRPVAGIGDRVVISGGVMEGQTGLVRRVRTVDGKVTYTLQLSDAVSVRWREVQVGGAFVEAT